MTTKLCIALTVACLLLAASGSWGAIGIYEWSIGPTNQVPAPVSYMLNTDATEVKIEVIPHGGSTAVRTQTFTGGAECTKGMHTDVWTWNGAGDGGFAVPAGSYDIKITATAAAITGTDLQPLWEDNHDGETAGWRSWEGVAVNTNPNSDYFGYVYAINAGAGGLAAYKGVWMFKPDGTRVKHGQYGVCAGGTSPWAIDVDDDGNVYTIDYTNGDVWRLPPDLDSVAATKIDFTQWASWGKWMAVDGSGSNLKIALTGCNTGGSPPTAVNLALGSGTWPVALTSYAPATGPLTQPDFDASGNVYVAGYNDVGAWANGSLYKIGPTGVIVATNPNIHKVCALSLSKDGQNIWVSRYRSSTTTSNYYDVDPATIYKIPVATWETANPYPVGTPTNLTAYGLNCSLNSTRTDESRQATDIRCDGVGNIAAAASSASWYMEGRHIGLYAPPDSGSTDARTAGVVTWNADNAPVIVSATVSNTLPVGGASAKLTVVVQNEEGWGDTLDVRVDLSQIGGGSAVPVQRVSNDGAKQSTHELDIGALAGTQAGVYQLPVTARDQHWNSVPAIANGTGQAAATVIGGWISGKVSTTGTTQGVEGATVTASELGVVKYTTTTDADGNYILLVNHDTVYSVAAAKSSHKDGGSAPSDQSVAIGLTVTDVNLTLDPKDIYHAKYGVLDLTEPYDSDEWRTLGETVCVTGVIIRQATDGGDQKGFTGYYYITDVSKHGSQQGLKIETRAGDPVLHEGDRVIVEGTYSAWMAAADPEHYIVPTKPAVVVATGQSYSAPTVSSYANISTWHGRYAKFLGATVVADATFPNTFVIQLPWSNLTPTIYNVYVYIDPGTGLTMPAAGSVVDVTGIASQRDNSWTVGTKQCIRVCKGTDLGVMQNVTSLAAAKALADGAVTIDLTGAGAQPVVVTYTDPGEGGGDAGYFYWVESPDRTAGLRVKPVTAGVVPEPGDEVTRMVGRIVLQTDGARQLELTEAPTVISHLYDLGLIPDFLTTTCKTFGGATDGGTPGPWGATGPNMDGLLVRIAGTAHSYGNNNADPLLRTYEWFWVDDGSGMPSDGGQVGVKVVRSVRVFDPMNPDFSTLEGKKVIVEGICSSQYVGSPVGKRIRVLRVRYDNYDISDKVQVLQ